MPSPMKRFCRQLLTAAVAATVVLHVWLLWRRLSDGDLLEAEVALRWLGAAALGAGALWLRRRGVSLWRGRSAAVFWLAVMVLHAGAPAVTDAGALAHQVPSELVLLLTVPVGLRWLIRRPTAKARRISAMPPRRRAPVPLPVLAGHYPPVLRRPPPF